MVNELYAAGLSEDVKLKYIYTMKDCSMLCKLLIALSAIAKSIFLIPAYEVMHIHMSYGASFYRKSAIILLGKMYRKKMIFHMHGSEFKEFYFERSSDIGRRYISYILNQCEIMQELLEEWAKTLSFMMKEEKIRILYNGVRLPVNKPKERQEERQKEIQKEIQEERQEVRQEQMQEDQRINLLFMGALGRRKGIYDLLQVMGSLVDKHPGLKLTIGGNGEIDKVQKKIEELQLNENVKLLGWVTKDVKRQVFLNADVFILPSYNEGMPMAILEAMSYGLPVISTKVGGIPKVIDHLENGLLVKAGNLNELKEAIEFFLVHPDKRLTFGHSARVKIDQDFNLDKNITRLTAYYRMLSSSIGKSSEFSI